MAPPPGMVPPSPQLQWARGDTVFWEEGTSSAVTTTTTTTTTQNGTKAVPHGAAQTVAVVAGSRHPHARQEPQTASTASTAAGTKAAVSPVTGFGRDHDAFEDALQKAWTPTDAGGHATFGRHHPGVASDTTGATTGGGSNHGGWGDVPAAVAASVWGSSTSSPAGHHRHHPYGPNTPLVATGSGAIGVGGFQIRQSQLQQPGGRGGATVGQPAGSSPAATRASYPQQQLQGNNNVGTPSNWTSTAAFTAGASGSAGGSTSYSSRGGGQTSNHRGGRFTQPQPQPHNAAAMTHQPQGNIQTQPLSYFQPQRSSATAPSHDASPYDRPAATGGGAHPHHHHRQPHHHQAAGHHPHQQHPQHGPSPVAAAAQRRGDHLMQLGMLFPPPPPLPLDVAVPSLMDRAQRWHYHASQWDLTHLQAPPPRCPVQHLHDELSGNLPTGSLSPYTADVWLSRCVDWYGRTAGHFLPKIAPPAAQSFGVDGGGDLAGDGPWSEDPSHHHPHRHHPHHYAALVSLGVEPLSAAHRGDTVHAVQELLLRKAPQLRADGSEEPDIYEVSSGDRTTGGHTDHPHSSQVTADASEDRDKGGHRASGGGAETFGGDADDDGGASAAAAAGPFAGSGVGSRTASVVLEEDENNPTMRQLVGTMLDDVITGDDDADADGGGGQRGGGAPSRLLPPHPRQPLSTATTSSDYDRVAVAIARTMPCYVTMTLNMALKYVAR